MDYGYWHATSISSLEDTVRDTKEAREHLGLPNRFVLLENWQNGGVIIVDTDEETSPGENPLYWIGMEDLGEHPRLGSDVRYESYGDFVRDRLPIAQESIPADFVACPPAEVGRQCSVSGAGRPTRG